MKAKKIMPSRPMTYAETVDFLRSNPDCFSQISAAFEKASGARVSSCGFVPLDAQGQPTEVLDRDSRYAFRLGFSTLGSENVAVDRTFLRRMQSVANEFRKTHPTLSQLRGDAPVIVVKSEPSLCPLSLNKDLG